MPNGKFAAAGTDRQVKAAAIRNAELCLDGEPEEDKRSRMIPIKKETV